MANRIGSAAASWSKRIAATVSTKTSAILLERKARQRDLPFASVLIATRDRASYLALMLATLERQMLPADLWEIVIVDGGSQDNTPAVVERFAQRTTVTTRFEHMSMRTSLGHAHNTGVGIARGEVLIFLSDDRLVSPNFLHAHLQYHLEGNYVAIGLNRRHVVTHLIVPSQPLLPGVSKQALIEEESLSQPAYMTELGFDEPDIRKVLPSYYAAQRQSLPYPWAYFDVSNTSVARRTVCEAGGFDPHFENGRIQSIELAYRMHTAEATFCMAHEASVLHQVHARIPVSEKQLRQDISIFLFKHPTLSKIERGIVARTPCYEQIHF